MGRIKKLKNNELVGGTDKTTIYPVTSAEAIFEEVSENNFKSQKYLNNHITGDRIENNTIPGDKLEDKAVTEEKVSDALMDKINSAAHGVTEEFETEVREALEKVVNTVSINNDTPLQPDVNKNINITVPENLSELGTDEDHRTVTDEEKSTWSGKQDVLTFDNVPTADSNNPVKSGGVYQAIQDIDVSGQISGKADKSEMSVVAGTGANADKTTITLKSGTSATVLTQHQDVSGKEDKSNKVTSFSSPTDAQYPSAKLVNDQLATKQGTISDLSTIRSGAAAGATAYQKPGTGIPSTDFTSAVQTSLERADEAAVRPYDSQNPNGMGYLVLKKNKTFAEQVTAANTIYEIRYDYDLNGQTVTLPANCVLKFNGGSLSNGTLVGQSTGIIAGKSEKLFGQNMRFNGTWNIGNIYSDWFTFGADDREILNDIFSMSNGSIIYINEDHIVSDISSDLGHRSIGIKSNTTLFLNGTISMLDSDTNNYRILDIYRAENVRIFGGKVVGNLDTYTGGSNTYNGVNICVRYSKNVFINGVELSKCYGDCIYIQDSNEIIIDSVVLHDAKRQGISVTSNVTNCSVNNFKIYNVADNDTIRACGIDIEPNQDSTLVSNIKFSNGKIYDCERGLQVLNSYASTVKDIHFYGVEFATQRNEKVIDLQKLNGTDVHFRFCRISSSSIVSTGSTTGVVFINSLSYAVIDFDGCYFDTNIDVLAIRCIFENGVMSFNNCRFVCGTVLGTNNNNTSFLGCTFSVKNNNPFPVVGTRKKKYLTNCVFLIDGVFPESINSCVFRSCLFKLSGTIPSGTNFGLNFEGDRLYDCTFEYNTTTKDFTYLAYLSDSYIDNLNVVADSSSTLDYIVKCSTCILGYVTSQNITYTKIANGTISRMYDQIGFKNFGSTATRPSASDVGAGFTYFDTGLGKMIVSNGTAWINMDGSALS